MADNAVRPWFRFYNEARNDRKLAHVARAVGVPKVVVLGAWVGLLTLANESPERGRLLLSPTVALTVADMAEEIGIETETLARIMEELVTVGCLAADGQTWIVSHFSPRQYTSDVSTERTRRFRARQGTVAERSQTVPGTAPESDSDTESETENESVAAAVVTPRAREEKTAAAAAAPLGLASDSPPEDHDSPDVRALFGLVEKAGILVTPANSEEYLDILDETGGLHLLELAFREAAATGARPTPKWLRAVIDRCRREGCLPGEWRTAKSDHREPSTGPPPGGGHDREAGVTIGPWARWG